MDGMLMACDVVCRKKGGGEVKAIHGGGKKM